MKMYREASLTEKLIRQNEIPKPQIVWEEGRYTTDEILTKFQLPKVIQYDVEVDDRSSKNLFLSTPLLAFDERMVRKIVASILCYDEHLEKVVAIGDPLIIPMDYEGWFSLVSSFDKFREELPVPHYTTIEQLVSADVTSFLIGGNKTIQAVVMEEGEVMCQHTLYPGERLTLVKRFCTRTKLKNKNIFRKWKDRKEEFVVCHDKLQREMTIPIKQTGVFYPTPSTDTNMNESAWNKSLAASFKQTFENVALPCVVKLLFGKIPSTPCPFTGLLRLEYAYFEHSVLLSTIVNLKNVLLEIPVNDVTPFRLAKDTTKLTLNVGYMRAKKHCEFKADNYRKHMKVCKLYSKQSSTSKSSHNIQDLECRDNYDPFVSECGGLSVSIADCNIHSGENKQRSSEADKANSREEQKDSGTKKSTESKTDSTIETQSSTRVSSTTIHSPPVPDRLSLPNTYDKVMSPSRPISERIEPSHDSNIYAVPIAPLDQPFPIFERKSEGNIFSSLPSNSTDENIYSVPPSFIRQNLPETSLQTEDETAERDYDYDYPEVIQTLRVHDDGGDIGTAALTTSDNINLDRSMEGSKQPCDTVEQNIRHDKSSSESNGKFEMSESSCNSSVASTKEDLSHNIESEKTNGLPNNTVDGKNSSSVAVQSAVQTAQLQKSYSSGALQPELPLGNNERVKVEESESQEANASIGNSKSYMPSTGLCNSSSGVSHSAQQSDENNVQREENKSLHKSQKAEAGGNINRSQIISTKVCRSCSAPLRTASPKHIKQRGPMDDKDVFLNIKKGNSKSFPSTEEDKSYSSRSHSELRLGRDEAQQVKDISSSSEADNGAQIIVGAQSIRSASTSSIHAVQPGKDLRCSSATHPSQENNSPLGTTSKGPVSKQRFSGQRTLRSLSSTEAVVELRKAKVSDKTITELCEENIDGKVLETLDKETLLERFPGMRMTDILKISLFVNVWRSKT